MAHAAREAEKCVFRIRTKKEHFDTGLHLKNKAT